MIKISDTPQGATFAVKVHPRARRNALAGEVGEALKVALTAPPVQGKANAACTEFLADWFHVPPSSVTIVAGQNSRNKVVRIAGVSAAQVRSLLAGASE